jgi:hypothetical protein
MNVKLLGGIPAPALKLEGANFDYHTIDEEELHQSLQGLKRSLILACEDMPYSGYTKIRITLSNNSLKEGCVFIQTFIEIFGGELMGATLNALEAVGYLFAGAVGMKMYISKKIKKPQPDLIEAYTALKSQKLLDSACTYQDFEELTLTAFKNLNKNPKLTNRYVRQIATPVKEGDTLTMLPFPNAKGVLVRYEDLEVFGSIEEEEPTHELLKEQKLIIRTHDVKKPKIAWDFEVLGEKVKMTFADSDYIERLLEETAFNSFKSGDFIIADVLYDPSATRCKYTIIKIHGTPLVRRADTDIDFEQVIDLED